MAENIVMLCRPEHERITLNEEEARRALGAHLLAARWDVVDYILGRLGEEPGRDWLRRRLFLEP